MGHVRIDLAVSLTAHFLVLLILRSDVDHGQDRLDDVGLQLHLFFRLLQKQVGVLDVTAQPFDLFLADVDGGQGVELKLVIVDYVLEVGLLLLELSDPLFVHVAFLLMVCLHLLDLLGQFRDLILQMVVLLLRKIVPFLLLFLDQAIAVPKGLVEDLNEYLEDVVEEVGPNKRTVLLFFSLEANLLILLGQERKIRRVVVLEFVTT